MNRRDIFRGISASALANWISGLPLRAAPGATNIYERIGVRPVINCRGTFTIISGSQSLPEVKKAIDEASGELTSPFSGLLSGSSSEWAIRGTKLLLALLVVWVGATSGVALLAAVRELQ